MTLDLKKLAAHREALLLAEAGAWLHMFGKLHEGFLKGNHDLDVQRPGDGLRKLLEDGAFGEKLRSLGILGMNLDAPSSIYSVMIHKHRPHGKKKEPDGVQRNEILGLAALMCDAHGRGSGIEKGWLADKDKANRKQEGSVYLSTAVGHESGPLSIQQTRKELYHYLPEFLATFPKGRKERRAALEHIEGLFERTVAETRRPLNDVTLYDQTAISVALFKALLASALCSGSIDPKLLSEENISRKPHWRLLRVGIAGLAYFGGAARVTDLLARKDAVDKTLNAVRDLIEYRYPLGQEVYRDENGSVLVVPDSEDITSLLQRQIQRLARIGLHSEVAFTLQLSERTRTFRQFGIKISEPIPPPAPLVEWHPTAPTAVATDICPVCGIRLRGPSSSKAGQRGVCDTCERWRVERSKNWRDHYLDRTVWLDEVADQNGRVALVVGRFNLAPWLEGKQFGSIRSITPTASDANSLDLVNKLKDTWDYQPFKDLLKHDVFQTFKNINEFYDFLIEDSDLATSDDNHKAERLALALFRQNPSFARIRRLWETTQDFWTSVKESLGEWIGKGRVRLQLRSQTAPAVGIGHSYELRLKSGLRLGVACVSQDEFLTTENIQRTALLLGAEENLGPDEAAKYVRGVLLKENGGILEEAGDGASYYKKGALTLSSVEPVEPHPTRYAPVIPIVATPSTFMALVPARSAGLVTKIMEKYSSEMGKVRNRLPLHLGLVFASCRAPLAALLEGGQRMLRQPIKSEEWEICQVNISGQPIRLELKRDGRHFQLAVPTIMGNGEPDPYYPYWELAGGADPPGRQRWFYGPNREVWVHADELRKGDRVRLEPSRFDFMHLDSSARRFEIFYDGDGRRPGTARPYYLEELATLDDIWKVLDSGLSSAQLHNLRELITIRRREWTAEPQTLRRFLSDSLTNANWSKAPTSGEFELLLNAAQDGRLEDVLELRLQIFKQRPQADLRNP